MTGAHFPHLFSPFEIRGLTFKNRIFSPAHGTSLGDHGVVGEDLLRYHEARAAGGAGLIILEGMNLHPTFSFKGLYLDAGDDAIIPSLARLVEACHGHGCKVFGQLFHAGRGVRMSEDGSRPVAVSASDTPDERYRIVPSPLTIEGIQDIVAAYGDAARRFEAAGLDGVEVLASMGYLISQFLNPRINRRDDQYGGGLENRLRLLRDVMVDIRAKTGPAMISGIRVSGDEKDFDGLHADEVEATCEVLDRDDNIDYFNIIAGSSASPAGWIHVFPPMAVEPGYVAPMAEAITKRVSKPVLVAGRINQPQIAERIIADGQAHMVGMARALIADPEFPAKAEAGRADDIRACVGCNQACVGHRIAHYAVSCIQHPETGREVEFGTLSPAATPRHIMVAGGGPAGMKAAMVAANRGHRVTLYEAARQLGGQILLAQLLPGRAEFGGVATNLAGEVERAAVRVVLNTVVDQALVVAEAPDAVVIATGATSRLPRLEQSDGAHMVDAWDVIKGEANVGASVVIADWRCDWIGLGVAEKLARDGCSVRLAVSGVVPGEAIQDTVRDHWNGELHKLGVKMIHYMRLYGADDNAVYFQHMISGEAVVLDRVDTLVTSYATRGERALLDGLAGYDGEMVAIGDCVSPRTVEEAVLEGLRIASAL
jgi:2,4-dienoyl-CoA reductase-like NADH-dependent reductase (Old Yellow Enzyme family)